MAAIAALPALFATIGSTVAAAAPTLSTIGTVASLAGAGLGAVSTIASGQAQAAAAERQGQIAKQTAELTAAQLETKGKEEQAEAQREAAQYRRQKDLALSSLTAKSAASGFTATDPTSLAIGDEISKYGTLQEQMAMYGGASRRAGLEDQAAMERLSGQAAFDSGRFNARSARTSSYLDAGSTILGSVSTLADRFNKRSTATQSSSYRYG